eukprot:3798112-Rhodomonas_salina.1
MPSGILNATKPVVRNGFRTRAHHGSRAASLVESGVELRNGAPRVELIGGCGGVLHALVVQSPGILDFVQVHSSACVDRIERDQSAVRVDAILGTKGEGNMDVVGGVSRVGAHRAVCRLARPRKVQVFVVHADKHVDVLQERVVVDDVGRDGEEARLLDVNRRL